MPKYYEPGDAAAEGKKQLAKGDFEGAAGSFDYAAELYNKRGDLRKEDEMRDAAKAALSNLPFQKLEELAKKAEKAAEGIEGEAAEKIKDGKNEGPGGSTEILPTAAFRRIEAAERLDTLAMKYVAANQPAAAASAFADAAKDYSRAADDLERSAENEPDKDGDEKKWDYKLAFNIRQDSIGEHSSASTYYREAGDKAAAKEEYDAVGSEAKKQEDIDQPNE